MAPENLSYEWTNNNDLLVYWNHPKNTNGLLKKFEISVNNISISNYLLKSFNDYRLKYKQLVSNISSTNERLNYHIYFRR